MSPYYKDAQKLAQKEFRACVSHGEHPYLPLLDDFLPQEKRNGGIDLGLCQIPAELIVGTRTNARANAFARNFMPLLDEGSEFASKWSSLCQSHLDEGIRDPVKVYEYLNRFYVEEGNKRVSVLKFFDAPTISANVTRILPERSGSKESKLYYEFLEYYRCTHLNFPEFSKPGSYSQFLKLLYGSEPNTVWTEEERVEFSTVYYYFRQAYEACGGKRLVSTTGDALLVYIRVYGYDDLKGKNSAEIKKAVSKVWEEITLQQETHSIDVKLIPAAEKHSGLLSKVLPKVEQEILKVAFVYDKAPENSGWVYGHELGRRHIDKVFQGNIVTKAYIVFDNDVSGNDASAVLEQAVKDGNTVIFTASPRLLPASLRAAVEHPKATIFNCSLNQSHRYIRTYYARMYEVKFIIGAIAGALSDGSDVGYICDYPIYGQIAGINAFALGVQMTSPNSKVLLEWSSVGEFASALERLGGVRLISSQDLSGPSNRQQFGLYQTGAEGRVNLALPIWNWGIYYEALLRRIRNRSLRSEYTESNKALNYYWGMSAGVVDVIFSNKLPESVKRLASILRDGICKGHCDPFCGPLYAQDGRQIEKAEQTLSVEQIIGMDWLAENVIGSIPVYEELNEIGKTTVGIAGVEKIVADKEKKSHADTGYL